MAMANCKNAPKINKYHTIVGRMSVSWLLKKMADFSP